MWANTGQNLRPDAPTAQDLATYNERQTILLKQTGAELAMAALTGGAQYGTVRLLNRLSPPKSSVPPSMQTIKLEDLDSLVTEHSKAGRSGCKGLDLTRSAALKAIQETQPLSTRVEVAGAGVAGPDIKFVSLKDGSVVETVQLKTAMTPRGFEASVRDEIRLSVESGAGSRVVAVVYPNAADEAQLMGKLRSMDPEKAAGRSIIVVDPTGKVIIPLQPWPKNS